MVNEKKKKRLPIPYYLFLALVLICAVAIITLLRRTEQNLTEMATAAGEGISAEQISENQDFEIQLLFASYEFLADAPGSTTARYYLEYAVTNHTDTTVDWTPPHLEYLVEEAWYLADSAHDLSETTATGISLDPVSVIGPGSYGDDVFQPHLSGAPLTPGEKRHGLMILDTITGEKSDDSPEYTNVFWPGPYRFVFESGNGSYTTLNFELPETAMDLSHQFLSDPWDVIYYEGGPSTITDSYLLSANKDTPSIYALSYQEVLLVSRGSSLCWEQEYRRPYRTYTLTFQGEYLNADKNIVVTPRLEFLRNTDWYPIPKDEISSLDPSVWQTDAADGYFSFTLYPAQDRSKDVHTDSQKFRTGRYRLLLPSADGKWIPVEFLLE